VVWNEPGPAMGSPPAWDDRVIGIMPYMDY
jgi:hypothetical protein